MKPPLNVQAPAMDQGPLDLRDYLSILWARKWLVIAVVATTTTVALFYSYRQTPLYQSSAEVVVRPARFDPKQPSAAAGFMNMNTELQVANSSVVGELAQEHLADAGIQPGSTSATLVEDAETIVFTSTSPDPEAAQATAEAHADAYLSIRRDQVVRELEEARRPYESRIAEINVELLGIARTLDGGEDLARETLLTSRYTALLSERAQLTLELGTLGEPQNVEVGDVLRTAGLPSSPSSPIHWRDGAIGLLVGLALGVGAAFLNDRLDDRMRGRDELELQSGAPVLAFVPEAYTKDRGPITLVKPESESAEAYKTLRLRLLHLASQQEIKTLAITSALAGEGKTTTTANLGVALAMAGKRVVIVSADLRRPRLQEHFPPNGEAGLSKLLMDDHLSLKDALSDTQTQNLWVLQAGPRLDSPGPLELLSSEPMIGLMAQLRKFADFVLIDTPPMMVSSDVAALAPMVDGVLFVADPRLVERPAVEQARRELQLMNLPLIGVIVNKHNPRRFRSYGSGYGYYADGPSHVSRPAPTRMANDERPRLGGSGPAGREDWP